MIGDCPTQLYRHFDAEGRLLYVGISLSTVARLTQHRNEAPWFGEIANVKVETFGSRREALLAEADAILKERPAHNRDLPSGAELERRATVQRGFGRAEKRLTAKRVASAGPGSHPDGGGLTLEIDAARRRWIWRYRCGNKRREMGLGGAGDVSLAEARAQRDKWRAILREGYDPIEIRRSRHIVS